MTREKLNAKFNKILDLRVERLSVYAEVGKTYSAYKSTKTVKEADKHYARHGKLYAKYERLSAKLDKLERLLHLDILKFANTEARI